MNVTDMMNLGASLQILITNVPKLSLRKPLG
jgi:hypothetical protein